MPGPLQALLGQDDHTFDNAQTSFAATDSLEFREYFADACPHCKHIDGAWKAAAAEYTGPVKFRQIECNDSSWRPVAENADLCKGIPGFPTMKMFKNGEEIDEYGGGRTKDDLLTYAKNFDNESIETKQESMMPVVILSSMFSSVMAYFSAADEEKQTAVAKFF